MNRVDLLAIVGIFVAFGLFAGMLWLDSTCAYRAPKGFVCDVAHGFVRVLAPQTRP